MEFMTILIVIEMICSTMGVHSSNCAGFLTGHKDTQRCHACYRVYNALEIKLKRWKEMDTATILRRLDPSSHVNLRYLNFSQFRIRYSSIKDFRDSLKRKFETSERIVIGDCAVKVLEAMKIAKENIYLLAQHLHSDQVQPVVELAASQFDYAIREIKGTVNGFRIKAHPLLYRHMISIFQRGKGLYKYVRKNKLMYLPSMNTAYKHLKTYKQGEMFTLKLRDRIRKEMLDNGDLVYNKARLICTTEFMLNWDAFRLDTTSGLYYNAGDLSLHNFACTESELMSMRDIYDTQKREPEVAQNVLMSMLRDIGGKNDYMVGYVAVCNDQDINIYGSFVMRAFSFCEIQVRCKIGALCGDGANLAFFKVFLDVSPHHVTQEADLMHPMDRTRKLSLIPCADHVHKNVRNGLAASMPTATAKRHFRTQHGWVTMQHLIDCLNDNKKAESLGLAPVHWDINEGNTTEIAFGSSFKKMKMEPVFQIESKRTVAGIMQRALDNPKWLGTPTGYFLEALRRFFFDIWCDDHLRVYLHEDAIPEHCSGFTYITVAKFEEMVNERMKYYVDWYMCLPSHPTRYVCPKRLTQSRLEKFFSLVKCGKRFITLSTFESALAEYLMEQDAKKNFK